MSTLLSNYASAHQPITVVADALRRAQGQGLRPTLAEARRVHGMLASLSERWEEVRQAFAEGLSLARSLPYPYEEARLLYQSGKMLVRSGEVSAAQEHWTEALGIFRRLGAQPYVERTEQALDAKK